MLTGEMARAARARTRPLQGPAVIEAKVEAWPPTSSSDAFSLPPAFRSFAVVTPRSEALL